MNKLFAGFVLPELVVVIGIIATLAAMVTVNLIGLQRRPSRAAAVQSFLADLRGAQTKATAGVASSGSASAYGIYIGTDRYVRFAGSTYNPSDPANSVEVLPTGFSLATTLPGNTVVFAAGSGEVSSFVPGANTITVREEELGEQTLVTINRLGVITQVD